MKSLCGLLLAGLILAVAGCATPPPPPTRLESANVLPLDLNENFQFRKVQLFFNDPDTYQPTTSETINFYRKYLNYGAVTKHERDMLTGNYFAFFWRARERADITVRLEYRQGTLGNQVMALEQYYPGAKGSVKTEFRVTGDDYFEFGQVTQWRVLLIVDGRIVAFRQSFMWR